MSKRRERNCRASDASSRQGQRNKLYFPLKAVQGKLKGMTSTPGQSRGCNSTAVDLASSVTSNAPAAALKKGVLTTKSPIAQSSTTNNLGFIVSGSIRGRGGLGPRQLFQHVRDVLREARAGGEVHMGQVIIV